MSDNKANKFTVIFTEVALNNLWEFLSRTNLKGGEVPAFTEIAECINKAEPIEEGNEDEQVL